MKITTESGSVYEFEGDKVRRVNADAVKRADGEWLTVLRHTPIEVGLEVTFFLESLAEYGPDDDGNQNTGSTVATVRRTTPIVSIQ